LFSAIIIKNINYALASFQKSGFMSYNFSNAAISIFMKRTIEMKSSDDFLQIDTNFIKIYQVVAKI